MAGEIFLVSGGSGGIGRAICRQLADAGYRPLVGYARSKIVAEQIARSCGGRALHLDLTDPNSIEAAISGFTEDETKPAGVILAASPPPRTELLDQTTDTDMAHQWQVNVEGPRRLLAGLVRNVFRKARKGVVIGILTKAMGQGSDPAMARMGAYVVAKYGMAGLLASAAADYPWLRIRMVSPTFTETDMLRAFDQRFLELLRQRTPFQQPDEVAAEILALVKNAMA